MQQRLSLIELNNQYIQNDLGKGWELGPVGIQKEPGSDSLSILVPKEVVDKSFVTIKEFKKAVLFDVRIPVKIQMSVDGDRGPYGLGLVEFDETVMGWYKETRIKHSYFEFIFELVVKGKELGIFNGVCNREGQQSGPEPVFWSSIRKGNVH